MPVTHSRRSFLSRCVGLVASVPSWRMLAVEKLHRFASGGIVPKQDLMLVGESAFFGCTEIVTFSFKTMLAGGEPAKRMGEYIVDQQRKTLAFMPPAPKFFIPNWADAAAIVDAANKMGPML